ncbi:MAG: hypothetical protein ACRDQU_01240 [Pseudonocardiaceae bacterium]
MADANRVGLCTVLTDAELPELGLDMHSRKSLDMPGLVGCKWSLGRS